ncbi:MAG: HlyD family efflux transporter periplasmic adaptor subunit [Bacteroidales bacterium]|nr:HlyD family efflux transporter periplasmic adaptor subunit [Bacteroidales bacterium]
MKSNKYLYLFFILLLASCSSSSDFDAQGTFEATEVTISSEATGKILWLNVEEGDSVTLGHVIGQIDTVQLALQRGELILQRQALMESLPDIQKQAQSLREQIAGATTDRDRIARLLAAGAATQQQLDNLNTQVASLKGQLDALLSQLSTTTTSTTSKAEAVDAQLAAIDDKIAKSTIVAPISGTVLAKYAEPGEVAAFGTPLVKLADISNIDLRAYFTSDQLQDVKLGQRVTVVADYGGGNTRDYEGTVTYIATQSEFTPKTIQTADSRANLVYAVKISVPNADHSLKLGLTGNVIL